MTAQTIAKALGGRKAGGGWTARCPAHDHRTPSLSIRDAEENKVLFRCHAGCDQERIIAALRGRSMTARERLPDRRLCSTFELEVAGLHYTATVSRFSDGRIAELFLTNHKSNSAADTAVMDAAIVASNSRNHASGRLGTALHRIADDEAPR